MTCVEKLKNGDNIFKRIEATYGPETEFGFPVDLSVEISLKKEEEKEYSLSICGSLKIKACESLGLIPIEVGGQCLDDAVNALERCGLECVSLRKIVPIWKKWHLNYMCPGSFAQERCLDKYYADNEGSHREYDTNVMILKACGLLEDKSCIVNGVPYRYGSGWMFNRIPDEVLIDLCSIADNGIEIRKKGE